MSQAISRAYEAIQEGIMSGRFAPGARLPERDLARELGLSRTPIREAMRQLGADGFVQHRPNAGVAVALVSEQAMADLGDLRAHLAGLCGRLAARRLGPEGHSEIAALCAAAAACMARHAESGFAVTDAFRHARNTHARLFDLCGNDWLAAAFHRTTFSMVMQASFMQNSTAEWVSIIAYFDALPAALASGDEVFASAVMEAYFRAARLRLLRAAIHAARPVRRRRRPEEGV